MINDNIFYTFATEKNIRNTTNPHKTSYLLHIQLNSNVNELLNCKHMEIAMDIKQQTWRRFFKKKHLKNLNCYLLIDLLFHLRASQLSSVS